MFNVVVFPAPFGPKIPKISPLSTIILMSLTTLFFLNDFFKPWNSSMILSMSLTLQLNCWINYPIWYTPYLNTATIWLISEFNLLASLELTEYLLLLKLWKPLPSSHFFSFVIFHEYQTKRWICIFISNNYNNIFFEFTFFFLFFLLFENEYSTQFSDSNSDNWNQNHHNSAKHFPN